MVVENRLEALIEVERWLHARLSAGGLAERARFALCVVADEALTNVVRHGYRDSALHEIRITLAIGEGYASIRIVDDGIPFDPFAASLPGRDVDLEHAAVGGRGIPLLRHFCARHDYQRVDGTNQLTLDVALTS